MYFFLPFVLHECFQGGSQVNVLPTELTASFDIRVAPDVDIDEFDNMVSPKFELS